MSNMFVSLQVIQTSKTLLENFDGVYERILQTQKAGKRRLDGKEQKNNYRYTFSRTMREIILDSNKWNYHLIHVQVQHVLQL